MGWEWEWAWERGWEFDYANVYLLGSSSLSYKKHPQVVQLLQKHVQEIKKAKRLLVDQMSAHVPLRHPQVSRQLRMVEQLHVVCHSPLSAG